MYYYYFYTAQIFNRTSLWISLSALLGNMTSNILGNMTSTYGILGNMTIVASEESTCTMTASDVMQ